MLPGARLRPGDYVGMRGEGVDHLTPFGRIGVFLGMSGQEAVVEFWEGQTERVALEVLAFVAEGGCGFVD